MAAPPLQPVPPPAAVNGDAFRVGFIGPGNLAESIARGVAASGVLPASAICTAPHRRPERGTAFASIGACLLDTNAQVSRRRLSPFVARVLLILCVSLNHHSKYSQLLREF